MKVTIYDLYTDFENLLVPEDNEKQYTEEPCANKYQNILLEVMAINYCVLMVSLVSLLRHT